MATATCSRRNTGRALARERDNSLDEDNPIDEISRIEAGLEELAEVSERCRKIILVSKVAIAGGVSLLLVMVLGLFGPNQVVAIGSIAVVLGGIVSFGSNVSTLRQTTAAMSAADALRSDLISRIDLRVVGDRTMKRIRRATSVFGGKADVVWSPAEVRV